MSKYIKGKERMKQEKKKNVVQRTPQTEKRENKKENNNKHNLILKEGTKCSLNSLSVLPLLEKEIDHLLGEAQNPLQSLVLKQLAQSQPILCNM